MMILISKFSDKMCINLDCYYKNYIFANQER